MLLLSTLKQKPAVPFFQFRRPIRASVPSSQLQHVPHHGSDPVEYFVHGSVAHEGGGGDQLVLLVHVAVADALAHVLAAQLGDGLRRAVGVGVPESDQLVKVTTCVFWV